MIAKIILLFLTFSPVYAYFQKAIYGEDNRLNLFEVKNKSLLTAAKATAVMVDREKLKASGAHYILEIELFGDRLPMCPEEDFLTEPSLGDCSGFLIEDDILVTAGHCVGSKFDCKKSRWVFDFSYQNENQDLSKIDKKQVYECERIIDKEENGVTGMDFSIIKLNRKVTDRSPLKVSTQKRLSEGTPLVLIGNPAGLPTKVAEDTYVSTDKGDNFFIIDSDSFQGSSGSAVLNINTLEVEGILVRGETDYIPDHTRKCLNLKKCLSIDECRGEDVIRMRSLPSL